MEIDVGRLIAGKYELVRLLGRGSMGEVWVGHHKTLGEHVAVKLLTESPTGDDLEDRGTAAARFRFEAQVAARLSKKTRHIVRVTDHGEEDGIVYLVMELLEGETLEAILAREGKVPLSTVTAIVTQVGRALVQAHGEGVLHRDLKPANVFLTRDEDGALLVKLLDFGIARAIHAHRIPSAFATAKGLVFGTPSYMSPEQARASSKLDHRCDLWALATIAYEGLSGELPVAGRDTDELLENLCAGRITPLRERTQAFPPALDTFFAKAFASSIAGRFASASELAQAFELAVASMPGSEPLAEPAPDEAPADDDDDVGIEIAAGARRQARTRLAVLSAVALLLVFAAVGVTWRTLAGAPQAASPAPSKTPVAPSSTVSSPVPDATLAEPAIPVSALPSAPLRPPFAGRTPRETPPAAVPSVTSSAHAPALATTPEPTPTPPPTVAPAPSKKTDHDRSEVL